jgi:hypothetical protein
LHSNPFNRHLLHHGSSHSLGLHEHLVQSQFGATHLSHKVAFQWNKSSIDRGHHELLVRTNCLRNMPSVGTEKMQHFSGRYSKRS